MGKPPPPPATRFPAPPATVGQAKVAAVSARPVHPIPPTRFGAGGGVSQPKAGDLGGRGPAFGAAPPPTRFGPVQPAGPGRPAGPPALVTGLVPPVAAQRKVAPGHGPVRPVAGGAVLQPMMAYSEWEDDNDGDKLFHLPSPLASPLRDDQDEILPLVRDDMVGLSAKSKKISRPQPRESVKGNIGEFAAQLHFERSGFTVYDANRVIAKNIDGIDHILDDEKHVFSQSKVHISGKTLDADVKHYMKEIDSRRQMAANFLKRLVKNKKISGNFHDLEKTIGSASFKKIAKRIKDADWDGEDIDNEHDIAKLIGKHMVFPVPSDVYDKLPPKYKKRCRRLPYDRTWFSSSLRKSYYMDTKLKLSEAERADLEDPEFKL